MTVTDNETAGVTLTTTLGVMEGADGSYTVVLASEPRDRGGLDADSGTAPPITGFPQFFSDHLV